MIPRKDVVGCFCRRCLNEKYGLTLERKDCIYLIYPDRCHQCGQMRNIVRDIRWSRRWKLWSKRKHSRPLA